MSASTGRVARRDDQRGQSVSVFVIVVMAAMILTAGLVIDGGQKISAATRAESAAAGAARAAGNAAATASLAGTSPVGPAVTAAKTYLAGQPEVRGSVSVETGVVSVSTTSSAQTIFLNALGISQLTASGSAKANIVGSGENR